MLDSKASIKFKVRIPKFRVSLKTRKVAMLTITFVIEWCDDYKNNQVDCKRLQNEIDEYMQTHDKQIEQVSVKFCFLMRNVVVYSKGTRMRMTRIYPRYKKRTL